MLNPQLRELANKIRDKSLRKKTIALLEAPTFEANGKTYSGMPLEISPVWEKPPSFLPWRLLGACCFSDKHRISDV